MRTSKRKYKNNFSSSKKKRRGGMANVINTLVAKAATGILPDVAKQAIMFTVVNSNPATKVSIPMICTVLNNITDEKLKTEIAMNLGKVLVALSEMDISVIFSDENKVMLTESLSNYGVHKNISSVIIEMAKDRIKELQDIMKGFAEKISDNSKAMMELVSEMCKHTESYTIPGDVGMFASKLNDLLKEMESAIKNNQIEDIVNKLKVLMKGEKPEVEGDGKDAAAPEDATTEDTTAKDTEDTTAKDTEDTTAEDTTAEDAEEEEEKQSGGKRKRRNRTKRTKKRRKRKLRKTKRRVARIN